MPAARRLRKAGTEVGAYVLILQCDTDFPSLEQVLLDRDLDQGTSVRRSELAGDAAIPVSSLFTTALGTSLQSPVQPFDTLRWAHSVKLLDPPSRLEELEAADAARAAVARQLELDQMRHRAAAADPMPDRTR